MASRLSLGLKKWVKTLWGFCPEINAPRGFLSNPHSVVTLWYKYENTRMALRRCIRNLLQFWLDKSLNKLISSTMRVDRSSHLDMNMETLERFCKDASQTFFNKFILISHQINSSHPPWESIDRTWEGGHATITYEKVKLNKPSFWIERNDQEEECSKLLFRHDRLQNMTYSYKLKVDAGLCVGPKAHHSSFDDDQLM